MPLLIYEAGKMDVEKKKELIQGLTETAARVTGIRPQAFTICIHENDYDNFGVGGEVLTDILAREG
jgi:4-oxalocrotonate tautomerase